jgi:ABC-2 type transport system permease protein
MADLRLVLVQTRAQLTSITRNRRAMLFSVVFPVVLMVMFDSIFVSGSDTVDLAGAKITAQAYFTGGMLAYAVALSAFSTLAMGLITERETGQLKRYRGTPSRRGLSSPRPCYASRSWSGC